MLGRKIFEWSDKDMVRGMSSSDDIDDGGFSPNTDAINLITTPGVAYSPATPTDKSTNLTGDMAISCENGNTAATADRFFLAIDGSTSDGSYYYWSGTSLTLKRTDSTNDYALGKANIACFQSEIYATSNTTIVRWVPDSVFNVTFLDFTLSYAGANSVPHPILVFGDSAFYGNGNILMRQLTAGVAPTTILTLPTNQVITALGIDPGSGKILISTTSGQNSSDTLPTLNRVLYYDGHSNQPLKEVIIDEMIQAFYPVGSIVFISYGQNIGYWNGAGIEFLRRLNVLFQNDTLAYLGHFTNNGSTLYVVEGRQILAFGPIKQGSDKAFYYAFKNQINSNIITHISSLGQNVLGIGFKDEKFYTFDTRSVSTSNTQQLFSNSYDFPDEEWIRWIRVIWKNQVVNNGDPGSIRLYDQDGLISSLGSSGILDLKNTSGASSAVKDVTNVNTKVKQIQFELLLDTLNPGVRRVIFYGDVANKPS